MIKIREYIEITGEVIDERKLQDCKPGLIIANNRVAYCIGHDKVYYLDDGTPVPDKYISSGPEGTILEDPIVKVVSLE